MNSIEQKIVRKTNSPERLSILFLMAITTGIAISFSVLQATEFFRFPADSYYYQLEDFRGPSVQGFVIAALYGICLTTFLFAVRTTNFWNSPGKILALLIGAMCVLNWGLEFFAAVLTFVRFKEDILPGTFDNRGFIFGIWYRNFAPAVGYILAIPLCSYVIFKSFHRVGYWVIVWFGFLGFSILMVAWLHLGIAGILPTFVRTWYFEGAIGIPILLLIAANLIAVVRQQKLDWWTSIMSTVLVLVWITTIALKTMAT